MKIKITKNEKILLGIIIFITITAYGAVLNSLVIQMNNNKMPFLADYKYVDNEYFSFDLNNKPNLWILSDIIYHGNGTCSIGDIMMLQGLITIPLLAGFYIYFKLEEKNG